MALYCENCYILFEGKRCPVCGRKSSRGPEPSDPCFLTEKEQIWSDLLADVLKQNGIPFMRENVLGAGLALKTGPLRVPDRNGRDGRRRIKTIKIISGELK